MPDSLILVIDDDPSILSTVTDILEFEGYTVATAANGAVGLEQIQVRRPALVLLDMRMPVLDGWQFMRALRQRGLDLPIVVMTAAQDAKHWAQEIGATGYLAKPFELNDLVDTVKRLHG